MTEPHREESEELDLATIARDDQLLDALGRGEHGPADDPVAATLAAWRTDLVDGRPPRPRRGGVPAPAQVASTRAGRGASRLAAAVIVVLALATGLAVAGRRAEPGGPLWPVTRALYPELAQLRSAEQELVRARAAVGAARPDEARRQLERARRRLTGVDTADARRLLADLEALESVLEPATTVPERGPVPFR
ncbi:anti-sigma-D factor RsdA [Micromonospora sp. 15K316]|uniref:anti-sigma-D factor RsdA n=1 Tax=Micromonospora sp. 15K316 TaxID=2530376 RepID=UPI00140500B9|nr:anti-sigma-D factor RsdA [Micromonospora sp. 15K316]